MAQTSNYANKDSLGNVVEKNYCGGNKLLHLCLIDVIKSETCTLLVQDLIIVRLE